jgi:release factor glutamine methyltransferase
MPDLATTVAFLINDAARRLRQAGVAEPRREAIRLWAGVTYGSVADVALRGGQLVEGATETRYERAVVRRSAGEPLAHVAGKIGFRRLELRSDARALIPRPETEGLVDLLLERVRTGRIVDVGTGSGCIALSLLQEGSFDDVVAVDRSGAALELAKLNCESTGLWPRLVQGDMCQPLRERAFDALVSNPPYLTEAEYRDLDPSVGQWEPELALVSGTDGMSATRRLLDEGRDVLSPGGWLALEIDCTRAAVTAGQAGALGWQDVAVHVDLFGRERYLLARRSKTR